MDASVDVRRRTAGATRVIDEMGPTCLVSVALCFFFEQAAVLHGVRAIRTVRSGIVPACHTVASSWQADPAALCHQDSEVGLMLWRRRLTPPTTCWDMGTDFAKTIRQWDAIITAIINQIAGKYHSARRFPTEEAKKCARRWAAKSIPHRAKSGQTCVLPLIRVSESQLKSQDTQRPPLA